MGIRSPTDSKRERDVAGSLLAVLPGMFVSPVITACSDGEELRGDPIAHCALQGQAGGLLPV